MRPEPDATFARNAQTEILHVTKSYPSGMQGCRHTLFRGETIRREEITEGSEITEGGSWCDRRMAVIHLECIPWKPFFLPRLGAQNACNAMPVPQATRRRPSRCTQDPFYVLLYEDSVKIVSELSSNKKKQFHQNFTISNTAVVDFSKSKSSRSLACALCIQLFACCVFTFTHFPQPPAKISKGHQRSSHNLLCKHFCLFFN